MFVCWLVGWLVGQGYDRKFTFHSTVTFNNPEREGEFHRTSFNLQINYPFLLRDEAMDSTLAIGNRYLCCHSLRIYLKNAMSGILMSNSQLDRFQVLISMPPGACTVILLNLSN